MSESKVERPDWVDVALASMDRAMGAKGEAFAVWNLKDYLSTVERKLADARDNVPGENVAQVRRDSYNEALEDVAKVIEADADAVARSSRWSGSFERYKALGDQSEQLRERANEFRRMRKVAP